MKGVITKHLSKPLSAHGRLQLESENFKVRAYSTKTRPNGKLVLALDELNEGSDLHALKEKIFSLSLN